MFPQPVMMRIPEHLHHPGVPFKKLSPQLPRRMCSKYYGEHTMKKIKKVTVSGTADKYIVIKNYNDEEVIISGNNKPRELMNLNGVSYIKVKG